MFALHTPLALYAANVSLIPWPHVVAPALGTFGAAVALWAVLGVVFRKPRESAAVASVLVLFTFYYEPASEGYRLLADLGPRSGDRLSLWIWGLAAVGVAYAAFRAARRWSGFTRFLNLVSSLLCLLALGSALSAHWSIRRELSRHPVASPTVKKAGASTRLPDIFYIVLDGYGRTDTFERLYGFSNRDFIEKLRDRGFFVADRARSNYVQTELSMASCLNLQPVEQIAEDMGSAPKTRLLLDERIGDSGASKRLRQAGYRYFAVTSGFPALTFQKADVVVQSDTGAGLYLQALLAKTPYRTPRETFSSLYDGRRRDLQAAFSALKGLAAPGASPKFVVAHVLAPHPPFVFGPNGEPRRPKKGAFGFWDGSHFREIVGTAEDYRAGYRDQAQYIQDQIIDVVDALIRVPGAKPIILIQGDHGPKSALDQESLEKSDLDEAFGILSAYRLPISMDKPIPASISPVNSFRLLFRSLFGDDLSNLPDRSYYSSWSEPLKLTDVTSRLKP